MATTIAASSGVERTTVRRATAAGAIGSFVEWYDYGIYGLLAGTLSTAFFPGDADSALLLTYAGFAVSFAIRPFGAAICGYLGDRIGRKRLLAALILLISGATAAIGVLPTYKAIGWAAPVLLIGLRLLQGFSAGGEVAGAMSFVAEHAEDKRRGFTTSWLPVGSFVSLLAGSLLARLLIETLGQDAMNSWAWRIPFLVAVPLGAVGFYIRSKLEDTPRFQAVMESRNVSHNPVKEALTSREHLKAIGLAIALPALNGPGYYIVFVYMPTYLSTELEFTPSNALLVTAAGLLAISVTIPFMARLSDRLGRKPVLAGSALAMAILGYPCFQLISHGSVAAASLGAVLLAVGFAGHAGVIQVTLTELFPTRVRYSAYSIGFSITTALFGGAAPLLMTYLIDRTGDKGVPSYAVVLTALITFVTALALKETSGKPLRDN
ncbi:MFS transporter [Streptomyces montanus]|uniref:MFS transporter n=1 Tax=Streptomyces montanus TaxID=2580423 RepID=A0A5R9FP79_9ACTN|nr:MFS transporter [Streptomyces montanus]TLS42344.1 MFS transporter [Streptomyces montanus]